MTAYGKEPKESDYAMGFSTCPRTMMGKPHEI